MGTYRQSRNIEATLIDFITNKLSCVGWSGISVEKTFKRVYDIPLDQFSKTGAICIRLSSTTHEFVETGSSSTRRIPLVLVDIFATDDGLRLDLKDYLISILKNGMPYYEYNTGSGSVKDKVQNGRLRIMDLQDEPVNFGVDKSELEVHDRYRHLITLTIRTGKVES